MTQLLSRAGCCVIGPSGAGRHSELRREVVPYNRSSPPAPSIGPL